MKSIQRVLVVQPFGLGDALFITPVLRALRTLSGVESVDLLLGSRTEAVFRNNPHVDKIFSIDKGKWHAGGKGRIFRDALSLWRSLKGRYELLLDFSMTREYGFSGQFFLGIPRRIGFDFNGRGGFLTEVVKLPNGFEARHVVDFYAELVELIGLEIENPFLEFYLSKEDREEAEKILGQSPFNRYIAIAPGGGESWGKDAVFKRWPLAHFIRSLPLLKERIDFKGVFILGSSSERELGEEIEKNSPVPVVNLCGKTSLGASAAILEKALLFFANDGGLIHLAHAQRVPLVAFYGPVDPAVYGPFPASPEAVPVARQGLPCRPCYSRFRYNSACADRECLTDLPPEEVMEFLDKKNFWPMVDRHCETHAKKGTGLS